MKSSVLLLTLIFTVTSSSITCPPGFTLINQNKCLKSFQSHLKHMEAEATCRQFGGTLVTVKNAIDNRAIVNFAGNSSFPYIWLGVYCFRNDTSTCYQDSGNLTYNNFAPGLPNVDEGRCIYMQTFGKDVGKWFSQACEDVGFPFICEVPTTLDDPSCTHNYNGYCYLPSHEIPNAGSIATFSNAQQICESYLYQLASVHSQQETDFIKSLYQNSSVNLAYIGAASYGTSVFQWVDGSVWDYDYINPIDVSNGSCLVMDTSNGIDNGLWYERDCQSVNYFLCKRKISDSNGRMDSQKVPPLSHFDVSQCNTTLYLAPGVVTSFGFPNLHITPTFCTWTIGVLGPYRVGLYFTVLSVSNYLNIYDEYGNLLDARDGNLEPFEVLAPTNLVTMTHDSSHDHFGDFTGFRAVVLPY